MSSRYLLTRWEPENAAFWRETGESVARRNLWISIPALALAFTVWSLWSVVVVSLDKGGFHFTKDQLFWLTALPALSGATLRIFYSFLVPIFGGRRFTAFSTASLLIPALGMGFALRDPSTGYSTLLVLALLCGLGGANFSSSMANISFFFPKAKKGFATGMNAGIGNLGVSVVQFVTPLVISASVFGTLAGEGQTYVLNGVEHSIWLQNAGFIWVPFIVISAFAAWFGMNDIADAKASFAEQAVIFRRKHNWLMCLLYIGTFGSFIGFSAGLALLTKAEFPSINPTAYAFLGPLAGALTRPVGGWISDRLGGARVTLWTFIAMIAAVFGVMAFLPHDGSDGSFARLPRHVHSTVRADGNRQRLDVPHDPRDLPHAEAARSRRQDRSDQEAGAARSRQGIGSGAGIRGRDRRVWRLLHPAQLRHVDEHDRLARRRALVLHRVLRGVRGGDVVLLCAPKRGHAVLS